MTNPKTSPVAESVVERRKLSDHEQMQDAQSRCVPCKLCGGHALISDAGEGAGYYVACSNSQSFKEANGCLISLRRLGGWAYNVMDWWNRLHGIEDDTPTDAGEGVEHKPWHETDAHRDLSRIIPDMEGKIAEAEVKFAHCLPDHLFAPLKGSITELRSLRHELAHPTPTDTGLVGELVEALEKIANGKEPGKYLGLHGCRAIARTALSKAKDTPHG